MHASCSACRPTLKIASKEACRPQGESPAPRSWKRRTARRGESCAEVCSGADPLSRGRSWAGAALARQEPRGCRAASVRPRDGCCPASKRLLPRLHAAAGAAPVGVPRHAKLDGHAGTLLHCLTSSYQYRTRIGQLTARPDTLKCLFYGFISNPPSPVSGTLPHLHIPVTRLQPPHLRSGVPMASTIAALAHAHSALVAIVNVRGWQPSAGRRAACSAQQGREYHSCFCGGGELHAMRSEPLQAVFHPPSAGTR